MIWFKKVLEMIFFLKREFIKINFGKTQTPSKIFKKMVELISLESLNSKVPSRVKPSTKISSRVNI